MSALALTALASCGGDNGKGLKVGLVCIEGEESTYDMNFINAFNAAVETSAKKGYVNKKAAAIKRHVSEEQDCQTALEQFADDGYNVVFTDSFGHDDWMHKVAAKAEYKDVVFSSATGTQALISNLPNYHNAFASIYEGRYLAGVAAGQYLLEHEKKETDDFNIGYVGAKPYAEVISGYTAWYLGVKSIFPNVKMIVKYTGEWYDIAGEKQAAQTLIDNNNCILISQHADSLGAPDACREHNPQIPNVSYNMNTVEHSGDAYATTYVGHSKINWQPYFERVIEAAATGKSIEGEKNQNWTGTLATGSVQYEVSDLVHDKTKITEAEEKLKNGTLHVFDTSKFTVEQAESKGGETGPKRGTDFDYDESGKLTSFKGDIEDDGTFTRDTELVADGYVHESEYRSAPAFDLIIDGITLLN